MNQASSKETQFAKSYTSAIPASDSPRPFLKWVGGKRQLLPELRKRVPARFGRYFEPFLGGGALFFDLQPHKAVLGDANERLVRTYRAVRDDVESVIEKLRQYPYDREFYLGFRGTNVDVLSDVEVAAWLIYVNKTGFNGMFRMSKKSGFNVPPGKFKTPPTICDPDALRTCSRALRDAKLVAGDFEDLVTEATAGDYCYFDPPYRPISSTSSFTAYTAEGFLEHDHVRLRDTARDLKSRGVNVLLSHSDHSFIRKLYSGDFTIEQVRARRAINSNPDGRGAVAELLIR